MDAAIVHFGFPLPWLEAHRSMFGVPFGPWVFTFLGLWFFIDFLIYGAIVIIAMRIYEKKLEHISKPQIYRILLLLSAVALVTCCWLYILWNSVGYIDWEFHSRLGDNYYRVQSLLRFLLGFMTISLSWFLTKYLRQASTT